MKSICNDITGKQFGRLTAMCRADRPSGVKSKKAYWLCRCSCGNELVVVGSSLRTGQTSSCGCYRNDRIRQRLNKPFGYTAKHALYLDYKYQARRRDIYFDLSEDEFNIIVVSNCRYCGKPPSQINKQGNAPGVCIYNGIDRIDNAIGYITTNTVSCCKECNFAKSNKNIADFLCWVKTIYEYWQLNLPVEQRRFNI